jgi:hypothetical protein
VLDFGADVGGAEGGSGVDFRDVEGGQLVALLAGAGELKEELFVPREVGVGLAERIRH